MQIKTKQRIIERRLSVGQEGQDYILEEGRHYLFRDANSFPRAKLMENCEL